MNASSHEDPPTAYEMDECTICQDVFKSNAEKSFLCCAHYFHKNCIDHWLVGHNSCPICNTIVKDDSFLADAYDGDYPEGANNTIDFNHRFGYILPTDTATIRNLMQQAANRVQQMGIHVEQNMLCYFILMIICIAIPCMQQWGQQWRQNVPDNAQQLEHTVHHLGKGIQNKAHQLEHNVQRLGNGVENNEQQLEQRIQTNAQKIAHKLQQVQQKVMQRLQQRIQKLQKLFYPK